MTDRRVPLLRRLLGRRTAGDAVTTVKPARPPSTEPKRRPSRDEQSASELEALARHARQRLALYRRRIYLGRGKATELEELERISAGADARAQRARRAEAPPDQPEDTP